MNKTPSLASILGAQTEAGATVFVITSQNPETVGDAERVEEMGVGKLYGAHAGCFGDGDGQKMSGGGVVVPARAGRRSHGFVEDVLRRCRAFEPRYDLGLFIPLEAAGLGQEVAESDLVLGRVGRDQLLGQVVDEWVADTAV